MRLKNLLFVTGLALLSVAAFFSITGMSYLFSSSKVAVIILFSFLEISKVVGTMYLHRYWKKVKGLQKAYMVVGIAVLMIFTSVGIYGYLSNSYMKSYQKIDSFQKMETIYQLKSEQGKIQLDNMNKTLAMNNERIQTLSSLRKDQENRLNQAMLSDGKFSIRNIRTEIQKADEEIKSLQAENRGILASLDETQKSMMQNEHNRIASSDESLKVDIGPLSFLSNVFKVDIKYIINGIILFVIFVFDPMGLLLLVSSGNIKKRGKVGRPKGSKNKKNLEIPSKKRGRPRKNMIESKELEIK